MSITKQSAIEALTSLGLTLGEAKTYVSLIRIGTSYASDVARFAEVPQPKIYGYLKSLEEKNFITRQEKRGIPDTFTATSYDIVLETLQTQMKNKIDTASEFFKTTKKEKPTRAIEDLFAYYEGENAVLSGLDVVFESIEKNAIFVLLNEEDKRLMQHLFAKRKEVKKDVKIYSLSIPDKIKNLPLFKRIMKSDGFKDYSEEGVTAFFTDVDFANLKGKSFNIIFPPIAKYTSILINIKHPTALIFQMRLYDLFKKQIGVDIKEGLS
ncbi:MAG: TrmB family transcriptional regulator [Candidatus Thorarchaeota archaeon]